MNRVPVYVGLDYHSKSVQVCVMDQAGKILCNRRQESSLPGVISIIEPLGDVQRVAIEACSGAADFGDHLHRAVGWKVSLAHAGIVSRMRSSIDKSDNGDARVLADLCRTNFLPEVWLPPQEIRELRALVMRRHQRTEAMQHCKQRIRAFLRDKRLAVPGEAGRPWTIAYMTWLTHLELSPMLRLVLDDLLADHETLRRAREALDRMLKAIAQRDAHIQRLMEIKGVGLVTACILRAVIGRFDRFRNAKQFSRYCGLTPRNASSGERVADAGIVRAGSPVLKTMLIQVAHRAARYEGRWREVFRSLVGRGKPACVAIVAVANRWCRSTWHELKTFEQEMNRQRTLTGEEQKPPSGGEPLAA